MDESIDVSSANALQQTDSYWLSVFDMVPDPDIALFSGDQIYMFHICFEADYGRPSILASPAFASFIYINPPADAVLQHRDSDADGLTDYQELYQLGTDPQRADSDADGYSDYMESQDPARCPLDPQDPPQFNGSFLNRIRGASPAAQFGAALVPAGDWNGDGREDVAVGEPGLERVRITDRFARTLAVFDSPVSQPARFGGSVAVLRGADSAADFVVAGRPDADGQRGEIWIFPADGGGEPLRIGGAIAGRCLGESLIAIEDRDGDGTQDLLVGAPGVFEAGSNVGKAFIFGSQDWQQLAEFTGRALGDGFGMGLAETPDIDGDNRADILIGAPWDPFGSGHAGAAALFSSSGTLIRRWYGGFNERLGWRVGTIGDQDLDGKDDLVIAVPGFNGLDFPDRTKDSAFIRGKVCIYSSQTLRLLQTVQQNSPGDEFGISFCRLPDCNDDGREDLAISYYRYRRWNGGVAVFSSRGLELTRYGGGAAPEFSGGPVVMVGDQDGDGLADLALGSPNDPVFPMPAQGSLLFLRTTGRIPPLTVAPGLPAPVHLRRYFSDPDGDVLTYSVTGSSWLSWEFLPHDKLIVSLNSSTLRPLPRDPGFVVITARDSGGGAVSSNLVRVTATDRLNAAARREDLDSTD